jgi:hypothetical protein
MIMYYNEGHYVLFSTFSCDKKAELHLIDTTPVLWFCWLLACGDRHLLVSSVHANVIVQPKLDQAEARIVRTGSKPALVYRPKPSMTQAIGMSGLVQGRSPGAACS